jgi:Leucine-rich repeat (LRR) protein
MSKSKKNNKRSRKTNISRKMRGGTYNPITKVYNLSNNSLTTYPDDIPLETEILYLDKNKLTEIPAKIGELVNLRELHINNNMLTTLPPEIGKLVNLTDLNVSFNGLTSLPPEIGNLVSLKRLYLGINKLTTLPREIGNLQNIIMIWVFDNQLTELPYEIGYLPNITSLSIHHNKLTTIPVSFINLKISSSNFHNNPYVWLHPDVVSRFPSKGLTSWYNKDTVKIMEKSPEDMKKDMMDNIYNNRGDAVFSSIPPPPPTFALPPDDKLGKPKLAPLADVVKENIDLPKPPANPLNKTPLPHATSKKKIELSQDVERYMSEFLTPEDLARYSQVNKATYNDMRNKNMGGKRRNSRKARKAV